MVDDVPPYKPGEQPTLHQILVAEKLDFEAKVQRAVKRKKWLKGELLRNLFLYYLINLKCLISNFSIFYFLI